MESIVFKKIQKMKMVGWVSSILEVVSPAEVQGEFNKNGVTHLDLRVSDGSASILTNITSVMSFIIWLWYSLKPIQFVNNKCFLDNR